MYENEIVTAVRIIQQNPKTSDDDWIAGMTSAGITPPSLANRLLIFIPMAYCRAMLQHVVNFPQTFMVLDDNSHKISTYRMNDEPVYSEAMQIAQKDITDGMQDNIMYSLAGRDAGFKSLNDGSAKTENDLRRMVLSPPVITSAKFLWGNEPRPIALPPEGRREPVRRQMTRKPWWRFW